MRIGFTRSESPAPSIPVPCTIIDFPDLICFLLWPIDSRPPMHWYPQGTTPSPCPSSSGPDVHPLAVYVSFPRYSLEKGTALRKAVVEAFKSEDETDSEVHFVRKYSTFFTQQLLSCRPSGGKKALLLPHVKTPFLYPNDHSSAGDYDTALLLDVPRQFLTHPPPADL